MIFAQLEKVFKKNVQSIQPKKKNINQMVERKTEDKMREKTLLSKIL